MAKLLNTASDTNTQAMTEVALGLSMAFFSLLILALLSISAGNTLDDLSVTADFKSTKSSDTNQDLGALLEQNRLSLAQADASAEQQATESVKVPNSITFIFYYKGQYFDANLNVQNVLEVNLDKETVVAVAPDLSFAEVMQVHNDLKDKNIQITAMDKHWQRAFNERIDPLASSKDN